MSNHPDPTNPLGPYSEPVAGPGQPEQPTFNPQGGSMPSVQPMPYGTPSSSPSGGPVAPGTPAYGNATEGMNDPVAGDPYTQVSADAPADATVLRPAGAQTQPSAAAPAYGAPTHVQTTHVQAPQPGPAVHETHTTQTTQTRVAPPHPVAPATVPPAPKKGIPVWLWILIPLVILGLLGALLAWRPWEKKEDATPSSTVTTSAPASTAPASTAPASSAPASSAAPSSAAPSSAASSAASSVKPSTAAPTSTLTPLAKPGSTKAYEAIQTLPALGGYNIATPLSTDMSRPTRSGAYSPAADKFQTMAFVVSPKGNQTAEMAQDGYKDIKPFANYACGTRVTYQCVSDIAGTGSVTLTSYRGQTPEQLQAAMAELLTKL